MDVFHIDILLTEVQTGRKIAIKIQKSMDSYVNIRENDDNDDQETKKNKKKNSNIANHEFMASLQWLDALEI